MGYSNFFTCVIIKTPDNFTGKCIVSRYNGWFHALVVLFVKYDKHFIYNLNVLDCLHQYLKPYVAYVNISSALGSTAQYQPDCVSL